MERHEMGLLGETRRMSRVEGGKSHHNDNIRPPHTIGTKFGGVNFHYEGQHMG